MMKSQNDTIRIEFEKLYGKKGKSHKGKEWDILYLAFASGWDVRDKQKNNFASMVMAPRSGGMGHPGGMNFSVKPEPEVVFVPIPPTEGYIIK